MPIPITSRQCLPFAAVFRDIQNRIHQSEITHAYISVLMRQMFCSFSVNLQKNRFLRNVDLAILRNAFVLLLEVIESPVKDAS